MKLEQQVVSLELAKKLKELGVKQESLFYWKTDEDREMGTSLPYLVAHNSRYMTSKGCIEAAAYTVAELADWQKDIDEREPWYANGSWWWYKGEEPIETKTQADAYAERGIHLIENNLITV